MATEPTTAISRQRRPRGRYPKTQDGAVSKREKRISEYLEADEVNAIIRAAPSPKAKLLMLESSGGPVFVYPRPWTSKCVTCRSIRPLPR